MLDNLGDNCVYGAGIYLPDQDAGWETGSAYDDQLERHGTCDAVPCICPEGRDHDEDDTVWEIVLCSCCGAQVRRREESNLSHSLFLCRVFMSSVAT